MGAWDPWGQAGECVLELRRLGLAADRNMSRIDTTEINY
jgi:hypothetical protein